MKENMNNIFKKVNTYWKNQSNIQKGFIVGIIVVVISLTLLITFISVNKKFVPLYNNLSLQEIGQIKDELESRGIPFKLEDGGTTITVPEDKASTLLVDLASQNIPRSGNIDYSFFSENASWGITDNEFNMIKLDAMNTELTNLIKTIEGIHDAQVMITLPKQSVFVSDSTEEASASIIIHTEHGYQFHKNQIDSLYHLVSKAVPNLPKENIVIRNQYLEYYDDYLNDEFGDQHAYTYQRTVKKEIEKDIQRRLQQMLGVMIGMNNVIVSVTADVDFTKENRIEELVDPVDLENMEGIPVSIETIHETYSGNPGAGGSLGTGEGDIPQVEAIDTNENGEYELVKETINNEFNHIRKEIVESPFKVRDIGIQVAVDNVVERDGDQVQYLTQQEQNNVAESISSILHSMIASSIDKEYGEIDPNEKISIVFQEFSGIETLSPETVSPAIPLWIYVTGIILFILILILIFLLIRNRKREPVYVEEEVIDQVDEVPELRSEADTPADVRKKQIERMANEHPEDFAKLLRSWIADD